MATYYLSYTAEQVEASIGKTPIIQNGYWYVWNITQMQYVATNVKASGASAYEAAVAGGYTGTEAEFYSQLSSTSEYADAAAASAAVAEEWASNPPHIGANGNWWIYDTTTSAFVDSGVDASITVNIADITMLPPSSAPYVTNTGTDTDPVFHLFLPAGKSITSFEKTGTSGLVDTYTIAFNDGSTFTYTVTNGAQGPKGDNGDDGVSPAVGVTAIAGGHRITVTDASGTQTFDVMDGTGSGDMRASTYDPDSSVASAGGIKAYVDDAISRIVNGNEIQY